MQNEAIMASAGTGKTYSLAMRYIRLVQSGASPSSIVALTFSKKAAYEITKKIIDRLLELSESESKRNEAIRNGDLKEGTTEEEMRGILYRILASREELQISTIDSFFMKILQAFPIECGIAGNISMIAEGDNRQRTQALMKLFATVGEKDKRELLEHLKDLSFGNNEKSLTCLMENFLDFTYPVFLHAPDPDLWGNIRYIWQDYDHNRILSTQQVKDTVEQLKEMLPRYVQDARLRLHFDNLFQAAENYAAIRKIEESTVKYLIINPFSEFHDIRPGTTVPLEITFASKDYNFPDEFCKLFCQLVWHLLTLEFEFVIKRTRALYKIFEVFDKTYAETTRNAGQLTFDDVIALISGNSPSALPYVNTQSLEERIDARTNHYMVDEFQDTSDPQWKILENLANEAIYADDRSFFMVGDIKQSIYHWRSGNHRLFDMICQRYGFSDDVNAPSRLRTLERSYRSSVPVIDAVNRVFQTRSFPEQDETSLLQRKIGEMQYITHTSAPSAAKQQGCVMMFEVATPENSDKDAYIAEKSIAITRLLREIAPFDPKRKKPLSVGILVRKNDTGIKIAENLLRQGFKVTIDGKMDPSESMAFSVYRQMLRLAAHPGDDMAKKFLDMLYFGNGKCRVPSAEEIRRQIEQNGIYTFTRDFIQTYQPMTAFDSARMNIAELAALKADHSGTAMNLDEFLVTLDLLNEPCRSLANTIEIMTIHKSKGLDFDVVIMPETSGSNQESILKCRPNQNIAVQKDPEHEHDTEWISFLAHKTFQTLLPEMRECAIRQDEAACYENCCTLYVAMTRARHALYIFNEQLSPTSSVVHTANLLNSALTPYNTLPAFQPAQERTMKLFGDTTTLLYADGDLDWYKIPEEKQTQESEKNIKISELPPSACAIAEEMAFRRKIHAGSRISEVIPAPGSKRKRPSAAHAAENTCTFRDSKAADRGTQLHEALAKFESFTTPEAAEGFIREQTLDPENSELLQTFLRSEQIRNTLKIPEKNATLWREKRFLCKLDDEIINGCFDRVVILHDPDGTPRSASIIDYKSDQDVNPETLIKRHAPQLQLYRKVLAKMTGLDKTAITCILLPIRGKEPVILNGENV